MFAHFIDNTRKREAINYYFQSFIWLRSKEYIYPAKEIIFASYYNRMKSKHRNGSIKKMQKLYYPGNLASASGDRIQIKVSGKYLYLDHSF